MSSPRPLFSVDLRSLVLFRVGLALLLLVDLAMRWPDIGLFLTDDGILPRDLRIAIEPQLEWPWLPPSIHALTGSAAGLRPIFAIHALAALALLLGYRTRVATIACWILIVSLHARAPVTLDGGDRLLSLLTFWGILVPLGARFSLDERAGRGAPPGVTSVTSIGTAGLLLQAVFLYVFAALEKWGAAWEAGGNALCVMFRNDLFVKEAGTWLVPAHPAVHHLTPLVTYGELLGGLLFFSPWWTDRMRILLITAFAMLQASFFFCIQVALFPFASILATVPFLPTSFWDAIGIGKHEGKVVASFPVNHLEKGVAIVAVFAMTWVNLSYISWLPFDMPPTIRESLARVGLHQRWNMYSPSPATVDGWPIVEVTLEDGSRLDLLTGRPPTVEKPPVVVHLFRTFRESGLFFALLKSSWAVPLGRNYLKYRVEEWTRSSGRRTVSARLVMMYEPTLPDCRQGTPRPTPVAELP